MNTKFYPVKKIQNRVSLIGCLMAVLTQAGISLYLSSLPTIQQDFNTTHEAVAFSLTAYMAGYALPMLFWGALSEALGRKRSLFIAILTFSISSALLVFANSIEVFIVLRFFQGAGGGGCAIIGRSAIRDVFEKAALVKAMSSVSVAFIVALGICQALGGEIQSILNWRYGFLLMSLVGFSCFALVACIFPETIIVDRSASHSPRHAFKRYLGIFLDKSFSFAAIGGGIGYGITIAFNVISPFLLQNILHLTPTQYGYTGFLISFSYLFGVFLTNKYVKKFGMGKLIQIGIVSIICFGIGMFIPAVFGVVNVYVILLPFLFSVAAQALIYPCAMALASQNYKNQAGYATALFGCIQQTLGSIVAAIVSFMPQNTQFPLAVAIIVIGIIGFMFLRSRIHDLQTDQISATKG